MINSSPYTQNVTDTDRVAGGFGKKLRRWLVILIVAAVVAGGGYFGFQFSQRSPNQEDLLKTARETYADDARYISFGANYVFAVPKSYTIDESTLDGVQLLIPNGLSDLKIDNFEQLFDAAIVAVQPMAQITPNDNGSVKQYIKKTLLPDLKKNLSEDIKIKYSMPGKYRAATITVHKDGQLVRQLFVYGGAHPVMVASKSNSDAYYEVVATLVGVEDATATAEFEPIKKLIESSVTLAQQGKIQELFNSGSADFKEKTTVKDLTSAVNTAKSFLARNVVAPGGALQGDGFTGTLTFNSTKKEEEPGLGAVHLAKVDGVWKLNGLTLPAPKK
ncbi:MAG: hypothetical protein AAB669_00840 [Patescibacteria group bacterium]